MLIRVHIYSRSTSSFLQLFLWLPRVPKRLGCRLNMNFFCFFHPIITQRLEWAEARWRWTDDTPWWSSSPQFAAARHHHIRHGRPSSGPWERPDGMHGDVKFIRFQTINNSCNFGSNSFTLVYLFLFLWINVWLLSSLFYATWYVAWIWIIA